MYIGRILIITVFICLLLSGGIPRPQLTTINVILFAVMTVLASLGIVFSVMCLLFNVIFMRRK